MSAVDEANEKVEKSVQEETEQNESVDSQDDLEKRKRSTNEFYAEGNTAHTQIFIQSLGNLNTGYGKEVKTPYRKEDKKYDLRDVSECAEFVEQYKGSEYLAEAIILSTFELVVLGDLPDLEEGLMEYLPEMQVSDSDDEEERTGNFKRDPYISLNTILGIIGGKQFVTEEGEMCAGLGKDSKQALVNIWEQFPLLRNGIVSWLIHISEVYDYRTSFDFYQIAAAFARVISFDIRDAKKRILPKLYSNPKNVELLGILAYKLYESTVLRKEAEAIILWWIESDSVWLWKSAVLAYAFIVENGGQVSFGMSLNRAVCKRVPYWKKEDIAFFSMILVQSSALRTMMAEIFCEIYGKMDTRKKRVGLAQMYINLIRQSYYRVDSDFIELPLAACDTRRQQESLSELIELVMAVYFLRKQLYAIMGAYLKELAGYDYSEDVISHISAFFYNMSFSEVTYQQDILHFLKNCNNRAAEQIYEQLYCTYEKEGELRLHE